MFRPTRRVGVLLVLFTVAGLARGAPPLSTTLPLKPLTLPGNAPVLPAAAPRPELTRITPSPCARPGQKITVDGRNLGRRDSGQLVMDTGRKRFILAVSRWTGARITAALPARFSHQGKVEIGIRSTQGWRGLPLPVVICRAASRQTPGQGAGASPPTAPARNPAPTRAADTTGASNAPPAAAIASTPRPVGSGTLIGAALPPLPPALQLNVARDGARRFAPHELVAVTSSMDDARRLAQVMGGYQGRVIRRRKLASLGMVMSTFRLPDSVSVTDTLGAIRRDYPGLWVDANHYFHPAETGGRRAALYRAVGRQPQARCGRKLSVGILDGPVHVEHPALRGQSIVQHRVFSRGRVPASTAHATAVASLLVGNPDVDGLGGVIRGATVYVGVVMQQAEDDAAFSTAEDLLSGLAWLLEQPVRVISLSLGGPRNALLEVALQRTLSLDVGVVAAAGNGGADAPPAYPAAQAGVLAVTSVDSEGVVARDANRGDYIDLAAPGVDLWVASGTTGGRYASGTSMAAPLVAAALAELGGTPDGAAQLYRRARDLGKPGKDPVYGRGLLRFPACRGTQH